MGNKCDLRKGALLYAPARVAFVSPIVAYSSHRPIILE